MMREYSPEVLAAVREAFDAVWATLYAHVPPGEEMSEQVSISLSQTLAALAADGITDPQELRRRALETMALTPN